MSKHIILRRPVDMSMRGSRPGPGLPLGPGSWPGPLPWAPRPALPPPRAAQVACERDIRTKLYE